MYWPWSFTITGEENSEFCMTVDPVTRTGGILGGLVGQRCKVLTVN